MRVIGSANKTNMSRNRHYHLDPEEEYDEEDSLLGSTERQVEQVRPWDPFKIIHRKAAVGSTVETAFIDYGAKALKVISIIIVTLLVLGAAVVSKLTLFLMTSQIGENVTRPYCSKSLDPERTYEFTVPDVERKTWIWLVMLAYFVPEVGIFLRSARILCFKSWKFPSLIQFLPLLVTESLAAIGSCLFVFYVLPEIDVMKGAFLTNVMCLIPALFNFIKHKFKHPKQEDDDSAKSVSMDPDIMVDIGAFCIQAGGAGAFAYFNPDVNGALPLSIILISLGWWENYFPEIKPIRPKTTKKSKKNGEPPLRGLARLQQFFGELSEDRKEFPNSKYCCYAFISLFKCLVFLTVAVVKFSLIENRAGSYLFSNLGEVFSEHVMYITEVVPVPGARPLGVQTTTSDIELHMIIWGTNILCTYICYAFAKFACKIMIQSNGFAFPIFLTVPILSFVLSVMLKYYFNDVCAFHRSIPDYLFFKTPNPSKRFLAEPEFWIWFLALLSQAWITHHIWKNKNSKLSSTENLFVRPMYDAFLIDQSLAMNRRILVDHIKISEASRSEESGRGSKGSQGSNNSQVNNSASEDEDSITRIYACATMWHENEEEMLEFLKSVYRLDEDQAIRRIMKRYRYPDDEYYELETHIFFDDAFVRKSKDDNDPNINTYVQDLIAVISKAASEVHKTTVRIRPPIIYPTPYGGRLQWTLPGKTKLIVHLKDKAKIRAKKRWSQVMYMYYLLGHRLMDNEDLTKESIATRSKNTYLLALDGDIDFQPEAVHLLVQYMKKNQGVGACCGRIHPVGSGAISWYQVFEYAVGHWMQKSTEHVIGCVLCSPGCFSLFRASALMDDNVMARYTTRATEARHYVQYDQGEDRWLCTLLLQRGYRVEYSAASDAYTHCPEGFNEFYNQRRRWMPSTTANILDLLEDSSHIKKVNDNISTFYILYQIVLMIGTVIGPGTIFLMLVGAFVTVFKVSQWAAFWYNLAPIMLFVLCCIICESNTQLTVAAAISAFYGLVMMAVMIGVVMQINEDGILAPSSLFFFLMMGEYVVAAAVHPKEFYCLKYGIIYLVTVPSMYLLLVIYSVFNMNNVSWGTRDVTVAAKKPEGEEEPEPEEKKTTSLIYEWIIAGRNFVSSCFNGSGELLMISNSLMHIKEKVDHIEQQVDDLEKITLDPEGAQVRKTVTSARKTTLIEGSKGARTSIRPRHSNRPRPSQLIGLQNNPDGDFNESDDDSDETMSDDLQTNSWFYEGELIRGRVTFFDKKEEKFWKDLIDKYLHPIEDDKKKVAKDLKDLRDKMVMTFFAINSLFVLVVFLLTLKKDLIHVDWPFNPKTNFTYTFNGHVSEFVVDQTYLQLEPIGFVFLIFFFFLMAIQFTAMLVHRFKTFSQIMANTDIDLEFWETQPEELTQEDLEEKNPYKLFKKLVNLRGINDEDNNSDDEANNVIRRNTVAFLAQNKSKQRILVSDLDKAFAIRIEKIQQGESTDLRLPRRTINAINHRRSTVFGGAQRMPGTRSSFDPNVVLRNIDENFNNVEHHFDNPTFEDPESVS